MEDAGEALPPDAWRFDRNGCVVVVNGPVRAGLYEAVYAAHGSPVAGLGLAAVRDFASYLKHGGAITTLRESPAAAAPVIGFGYSQSGRFLREFVRDGFNADERGRTAFDGLFIASAGAGGGSFNHRFAMPGQAGNSVLSILRPVDLPPFTDDGLLARARAAGVVPRIFYTFSSTEYWARAGSLTHTTEDGTRDVPLADSSRLYFLSGTPHAGGPLPPIRETDTGDFRNPLNFAQQRWALRALLLAMDDWLTSGKTPPASRYPTIAKGTGRSTGGGIPCRRHADTARVHAVGLAAGFRARLRLHRRDSRAAPLGRTVSRAGPPGGRRRQRSRRRAACSKWRRRSARSRAGTSSSPSCATWATCRA